MLDPSSEFQQLLNRQGYPKIAYFSWIGRLVCYGKFELGWVVGLLRQTRVGLGGWFVMANSSWFGWLVCNGKFGYRVTSVCQHYQGGFMCFNLAKS